MENQTCFKLDEALAQWRGELTSQPGVSAEKVRELESHLQDSLTDLQQRGLTLEESFWLARRRLGSTKAIAEEIVKEDPSRIWTDRAFWITASLIVVFLFLRIGSMPFQAIAAMRVNPSALGQASLLYMIPMYCMIGWAILAMARGKFPKFLSGATRFLASPRGIGVCLGVYVIVAICALWLLFWAISSAVNPKPQFSLLWNLAGTLSWPLILGAVLFRLAQMRSKQQSAGRVAK